MTLAYEDVTVANRFQGSQASEVHSTRLPDGFPFKTVPTKLVNQKSVLKTAMCGADFKNMNSAKSSDPLERLAKVIEALRATDGFCTVSPTESVPCRGGYCVPFLESQGSVFHTSCVTEAEMFPPIADTAIEVKRGNVTLNPSTAFGRPLYFGGVGDNTPTSCVRVTVGGAAFTMSDVVFDQTGCESLAVADRIPVLYGGNSAAGSYISGISVLGEPAPAVTYLGNAADGDAPYLVMSEPDTASAYLGDVGFVFEAPDDPSEPIGLVASMARTIGTQRIEQCARSDCSTIRTRSASDRCAEAAVCSQRGCPWDLKGPGCTDDPDGPCFPFCTVVLTDLGIGCRRGFSNATFRYAIAAETETQLVPQPDATVYSGISTVSVAVTPDTQSCILSRPPLRNGTCAPDDPNQQWLIDESSGVSRLHPVHRPFTCMMMWGDPDITISDEYDNATIGFFPCPPCDVGVEETVDVCDGTAPTYEEAVWYDTPPYETLPIPVSYDDHIVVAAFPNGSCLLHSGDVWADCRTECIRDVPAEMCNGTDVKPAGGLLQACRHDGSVAAIVKRRCTTGGPIVQPPSGSGASALCFQGYYHISAHGRGYVSGAATINGVSVTIFTSQAVIQPYDESAAVVGVGVDVFNISAVTALFGQAFERNLYPSNKSTAIYLVAAVVAFSLGIIMLVMAMVKLAKSKQD